MEGSPWLHLPGWLVLLPWPTPTGSVLRPALILSDREMPAAGQILRLALAWDTEACLVSPLPPIATLKIPDISALWVGAALAMGGPFLVVNDPEQGDWNP